MAIAAAIDLCSLDFETEKIVREVAPEIAVKICELIPNSDPARVLFKQANPAIEEQEPK